MLHLTAADAPRFALPGVEFTGYASPSRGSREICTWRITVAAGLHSPEPHTIDRDEIFMVASGAVRLSPDGAIVGGGDAAAVPGGHNVAVGGAVVPPGPPIQLITPRDEPAEVYVVIRADFAATAADGTAIDTPPW